MAVFVDENDTPTDNAEVLTNLLNHTCCTPEYFPMRYLEFLFQLITAFVNKFIYLWLFTNNGSHFPQLTYLRD